MGGLADMLLSIGLSAAQQQHQIRRDRPRRLW